MTETIESIDPAVTFDGVSFIVPTKGSFVQNANGSMVGEFDKYEGSGSNNIHRKPARNHSGLDGYLIMDYNLAAKTAANMSFSVGLYQFKLLDSKLTAYSPEEDLNEFYMKLLDENMQTYITPVSTLPLDVFDYRQAISRPRKSPTLRCAILNRFPDLPRTPV